MKKIILLLLATMLLTSCKDKFSETLKEAAFWPERAYEESEYFMNAAGDMFDADHFTDMHYDKRSRIRANYLDQKKRFNQILKEMDDYYFKLSMSSEKNEKKKVVVDLYLKQKFEVEYIVKQCIYYVEDINKHDLDTYRKHRYKLKEMNEQIDRDYLQAIKAGQNPFK